MKTVVYSNRLTILPILNCRSWKLSELSDVQIRYPSPQRWACYTRLLRQHDIRLHSQLMDGLVSYISWLDCDWRPTHTGEWSNSWPWAWASHSLRQPITTTPYHCRVTVETCDTERPTGQLRLTKIMATPLESLRQIVRQEICNCWPCTSHICDICKAFIKSWEILDPLILRQNYINCIQLYPTYHFLPSLCEPIKKQCLNRMY